MINFFSQDIEKPKLQFTKIKGWVKDVITSFNLKEGNISVIFCSDSYLLEMNKKYLDHNYFTDIITFNYNSNNIISGDIFISVETVNRNSSFYDVTFKHELLRVIIHGILHLIGFDDANEMLQKKMREEEDKALSLLTKWKINTI